MSTMKAQSAKTPAKKPSMVPAKAMSTLPATRPAAKVPAKASTKASAKTKPPAKAKAPARQKSSQEAMLARLEAVRLMQREEGHFDCFGRAGSGYCDQGGCTYHAECLSVSRMIHAM